MSETVDWVNKACIGYVMNASFSAQNATVLSDLSEAVRVCTPKAALHITLLDLIAPLVDYDGRGKDKLFQNLQASYDSVMTNALRSIGPIDVHFDQIKLAPSTIYVSGSDNGQFASIRHYFVNHAELLPGTKLPPTIVHSSIGRFVSPIDLDLVESFLGAKHIDFTEGVTAFRLNRTTREPALEYETLKRYELSDSTSIISALVERNECHLRLA